uniref:SET domain-containing protein n=1 Tax=Corethron hystrix TaxID=216773 RepID=A0A7S1B8I2_9STRA|mmetsp:Transcript_16038/g.36093  ORF Transcript_16038/g.36093 Transcript_16038/m.36093 type:complete len:481 (+) Transcript_16038:256-1698(+)
MILIFKCSSNKSNHYFGVLLVLLLSLLFLFTISDAFGLIPATKNIRTNYKTGCAPQCRFMRDRLYLDSCDSRFLSVLTSQAYDSPSLLRSLPSTTDSATKNRVTGESEDSPKGEDLYKNLIAWILKPKSGRNGAVRHDVHFEGEETFAFINPAICISNSDNGDGFGVIVSRAVEKNEVLFTIPVQKFCLTTAGALEDEYIGAALRNIVEATEGGIDGGGGTVVLAAYVAYLYLRSIVLEESLKLAQKADYLSYLQTLPLTRPGNKSSTAMQDHILWWSRDEVDKYLGGSVAHEEAVDILSEVEYAIKSLENIVKQALLREKHDEDDWFIKWIRQPQKLNISDKVIRETIRGAFVAILSRSFSDEETIDGSRLAPLLDMLQHNDRPNVCHSIERTNRNVRQIVVTARFDLEEGTELLNQYQSDLEAHRFFVRFGFIPTDTQKISRPIETSELQSAQSSSYMRSVIKEYYNIFFPSKTKNTK